MMDPNHFLMIMLSRFELYQIFSTPDYGKRFSTENTNKVPYVLLQEKMCNFVLLYQDCAKPVLFQFCLTSLKYA